MEDSYAFFCQKDLLLACDSIGFVTTAACEQYIICLWDQILQELSHSCFRFTIAELKAGLLEIGVRMAGFELKEMIELADADDDKMISFTEYANLYGSGPWFRAQAAASIKQQIEETWMMLDTNRRPSGANGVADPELLNALPFTAPEDIEKMVRIADADMNNKVSHLAFG